MQLKVYKETHPSSCVSFSLNAVVLFPNMLGSYKLFTVSYFFQKFLILNALLFCRCVCIFYLYFTWMFLLMKLIVVDYFLRVATVFINGPANISRWAPAEITWYQYFKSFFWKFLYHIGHFIFMFWNLYLSKH